MLAHSEKRKLPNIDWIIFPSKSRRARDTFSILFVVFFFLLLLFRDMECAFPFQVNRAISD